LTLRQFVGWLQIALVTGRQEGGAEANSAAGTERPPYVRLMTVHQAKGLEFPLVVIPEVQFRLNAPDRDPKFLVMPGWGLDLDLTEQGIDTRSSRFGQELARTQRSRVSEEMRVFYVAATRAQHGVVLIGAVRGARPNGPESEWYAWQDDEVVRAWPRVAGLGAQFRRV